jgi:hypothetical protein
MENFAPPNSNEGWKEVINRLRAFAEDQISIYVWFRGGNALPQGFTADDFTQEAILRYLDKPSIYDPKRGKFLAFLKYYILRRLVYNLSVLTENEKGFDIYQNSSDENGDDETNYEDYLPGTLLDIESEIDGDKNFNTDKYIDLIIERIDGKTILENIFEGIFIKNLKRREICQQYNIPEQDYDNAVRRLNTIIKSIKLLIR